MFLMKKIHFLYLAAAAPVWPGGFGISLGFSRAPYASSGCRGPHHVAMLRNNLVHLTCSFSDKFFTF